MSVCSLFYWWFPSLWSQVPSLHHGPRALHGKFQKRTMDKFYLACCSLECEEISRGPLRPPDIWIVPFAGISALETLPTCSALGICLAEPIEGPGSSPVFTSLFVYFTVPPGGRNRDAASLHAGDPSSGASFKLKVESSQLSLQITSHYHKKRVAQHIWNERGDVCVTFYYSILLQLFYFILTYC